VGRATRIEATVVNWRDTPGVAGVENDRLSMGVYVRVADVDASETARRQDGETDRRRDGK
jgi:hypothetical protein